MKSTTSEKTIEVLHSIFSVHGIPKQIVSDNGPQFVSDEFKAFLKANAIHRITSSPYHPQTNGLAERFVRTMKEALKNSESDILKEAFSNIWIISYCKGTVLMQLQEIPQLYF